MQRVRIKDIAEQAGVSIGTVDRVLHNRGEVKKATKDKILEIAKKLDYKPNVAAQALKSSASYKIAVLMPLCQGDNQFWSKHPEGIQNAVETAHPLNIEVHSFLYEMHNGEDFNCKAEKILKLQPNGVIIAPILKKESLSFCGQLDKFDIPYVFIDTNIEDTNCLSFVGEDAYQSGRVAASLIDFGIDKEKDILIINIAKDLENIQHLNSRNQGFQSYFLDSGNNNGLKISVEIPSVNEDDVSMVMDKVLANNPNIAAIMVSSSRTFAIAKYLKQKSIKNIFLVGYEVFGTNIKYLKNGTIKFLIGQRPIEQGEKSLKRLIDFINQRQVPEKKEFQAIDIINVENINLFL